MKELLISELMPEKVNLLDSLCLLEQEIFGEQPRLMEKVQQMAEQLVSQLSDIEDPLEQAEKVLDVLFVQQLLTDTPKSLYGLASHRLDYGLDFISMAPTLKIMVMVHVIRSTGLNVDVVFVPDDMMIRITCDDTYAVIFDCINGEPINWQELDQRLQQVSPNDAQLPLQSLEDNKLISQHLTSLKNALIREQQFKQALTCVDILLAMTPDDPYQRRDRGFLLQQMDCFKVAYDDYRYFVESCPQDPAAKILQLQLDQIAQMDTVLH
ncbi:tetratricopeptide repeat protein [Thalassotalea mangrovi]|uniref:Tetratricopeptide repeat protein n=1 Tax=Thalassotalea mangrovi TaxID=2572245 RepID=A0A4U1B352_9GAMM|nr:tetratricopeptide repeat protein [Thalassotalea mangrovi]TKB44147.1 tetratricopeptide repeat protein [Thalassotalea mangrovi]